MNTNNHTSTAAPGAGSGEIADVSQIEKWAKRDIATAISFLNAIYSDPDLLAAVAAFIHGRIVNDANRKAQEGAQ